MTGRRLFISAVAGSIALGGVCGDARAERLPVRKYTTAEGLASDYIVSIYCDSRGFLWFSTRDGLSRFDGLRFTTYGVADGLPSGAINRVLETRAGVYWIGTNGSGVYRFNPRGRRPTSAELQQTARNAVPDVEMLFTAFRVGIEPATNRVNVILEDHAGGLWVGTDGGLFRMHSLDERVEFHRVELPVPADVDRHGVHALVEDREGSLWIGGGWGLSRRLPDGRTIVYRVQPTDAREVVDSLLFVDERQLWVAFRYGLMVLHTAPVSSFGNAAGPIVRTLSRTGRPQIGSGGATAVERELWYTSADGLPYETIGSLFRADNGRIWVGTVRGLGVFDGSRFRAYTTANGLTDNYVTSIVGDRAGNVWIGSVAGITRVTPHGLVTYDEADGLARARVYWVGEASSGDVVVVTGNYMVSQFDGTRFATIQPNIPPDARCAWTSPCGFLDRAGEWWLLTSNAGVYRFPKIARLDELLHRRPQANYTSTSGLPTDNAFKMYEDRRGNVWIATSPAGLVEWQRPTGVWRAYTEAEGMPASRGTAGMVSAFAEDRAGSMWIGFYDGGLGRLRDGRVELFGPVDGVPVGLVTALHLDAAGRLWVATNQAGLARVDDPKAARPLFAPLNSNINLASPNVRCLTEDAHGRIYAGTSRGIEQIDPATGRVEHFGTGEGLASEFVNSAFRDQKGALWFGTMSGLSRLDGSEPPSARERRPTPTLISGLRVRGVMQPVSELGETVSAPLTLSPDQNHLEIEFFAITFNAGESLKYQYRIEGIDAAWSPPTELRSVNYGRLPSGAHRFVVRSVRSDGAVGDPAVVSFMVLPPIYARWWFIALAILSVGAAVFALYRLRVAQLLRVERVRARIATDLHDDIGASLSQIAILAEVARAEQPPGQDSTGPLARIAETSRALVDSMSDIVWAINPEVDSLSDLIYRMRRFAEDILSASEIELTFHEPELRPDPSLGPDIRREIFLILKESVTNIAKHAECARVTIAIDSDRHRLRLRVTDDGKGFEPEQETNGNGLANMRRRLAAIGGRLKIESKPGRGTTIELELAV
jgi:ligand-binding sensor domain-containing protein/signal transduction histidine kinase